MWNSDWLRKQVTGAFSKDSSQFLVWVMGRPRETQIRWHWLLSSWALLPGHDFLLVSAHTRERTKNEGIEKSAVWRRNKRTRLSVLVEYSFSDVFLLSLTDDLWFMYDWSSWFNLSFRLKCLFVFVFLIIVFISLVVLLCLCFILLFYSNQRRIYWLDNHVFYCSGDLS